jgi:hypothetical protein
MIGDILEDWADQHESRSRKSVHRHELPKAQAWNHQAWTEERTTDCGQKKVKGKKRKTKGLMRRLASHCAGSSEEAERLVVHGTDLRKRFNVTLQAARERVYYGLKASATLPETMSAEKEEGTEGEADSTEGLRKRRRSRVETLMRCSVER